MDVLEEVLQRLAGEWPAARKDALRALAQRYLAGDESDALITEVRAIRPAQHGMDAGASWVVFATWALNRAGRFGQRLKLGVLPPEEMPESTPRNIFAQPAITLAGGPPSPARPDRTP